MNAYDILQTVRDYVGEGTGAEWSDAHLLRRINLAHRTAGMLFAQSKGQWLIKSADLTPVASVITLPPDCSKPIYMEKKSDGYPIEWLGSVASRRVSRGVGSSLSVGYREAYPLLDTLEVNVDSFTEEVTLWYQKRIPNLHTGTASAGGATSLTFPDDRNVVWVDDYYNESIIEVVSGTGASRTTISDYVGSTRVATLAAGTFSSSSVYGTVSMLPEETDDFIVLQAALVAMAKPSASVDERVFSYYLSERNKARKMLEEWIETRTAGIGDRVVTRSIE